MASIKPGWLVVDFEGTGLLCVEKDDSMNKFSSDFEAAQAYIKAGGKLINSSLDFNMDLYPINTPNNVQLVKKAVYVPVLLVNNKSFYIQRTGKSFFNTTDDMYKAKKLAFYEIPAYLTKVKSALKALGHHKEYKLYIDLLEIKRSNDAK